MIRMLGGLFSWEESRRRFMVDSRIVRPAMLAEAGGGNGKTSCAMALVKKDPVRDKTIESWNANRFIIFDSMEWNAEVELCTDLKSSERRYF